MLENKGWNQIRRGCFYWTQAFDLWNILAKKRDRFARI